jgi:hypothetical protein
LNRLYIDTKDFSYYEITLSDKKTIKGILKFREYIERDAMKGSKEALCLLVDFDNIVSSLDLNKDDLRIMDYMQSGFENYNYDGQYLSDATVISIETQIDKDLVLKRINRIVNLIYEKNYYNWQNTYCKKYKDWIIKNKEYRNKILQENRELYKSKKKNGLGKISTFENKPETEGFVYDKLREMEESKRKLEHKIKKCEDKRERSKIISFLISLSRDINDIKKNLKIPINEKQPNKIKENDRSVEINNFDFINESKYLQDNLDSSFLDIFTAWRIQNIIQKYMTKRQQIIFNFYFIKRMKQIKIAEDLKCSQQSISDELKNIVTELQFLIKNT